MYKVHFPLSIKPLKKKHLQLIHPENCLLLYISSVKLPEGVWSQLYNFRVYIFSWPDYGWKTTFLLDVLHRLCYFFVYISS